MLRVNIYKLESQAVDFAWDFFMLLRLILFQIRII